MSTMGSTLQEPGSANLLVGRFAHSLDPKRRLTVPAVWREQMGSPERVYVMPDVNQHCLNIFSPEEMEQRLQRLRRRSISDARAAEFARRLGEASECLALDVQGRIRIRDRLLAFAGLTDQVVMLGALDHAELWSPERRPEPEEVDLSALGEASRGVDF